jgi:calcineurin-like phosphoesterase family protein
MAQRKSIRINRSDRFISDTHFGHQMMASRRELSLPRGTDHDTYLIDCWNAVVSPSDTVWHLGDFAWDGVPIADVRRIFDQLNGRKNLLVGNHDTPDVEKLPWERVLKGPVHWKDAGTGLRITGGHWPMREWDGWWRGAVHLHGHVHGNLPNSRRSLDLSPESIGFFPSTFAELHARMQALPELDFSGVETVPYEVKP